MAQEEEEEGKEYRQVKHVFEVKVRDLKNIPILNKFVRDY